MKGCFPHGKLWWLLIVLSVTLTGRAATLRVYPGATIQEAISRSAPGDTIVVYGGVYREHLTVDRAIVLLGRSRPVIDGGGEAGTVVTVTADNVTIKGLRVQNSGARIFYDDSGIKLVKVRSVQLLDNQLFNNCYGVYLKKANRCIIRNNVFYGRAERKTEETTGDAIHLWNSRENLVENNKIEHHRDGIYIEFSPRTVIRHNRVARVIRYGVHYMYSHDNVFEDNVFEYNRTGSSLMYSKRLILRRNLFYRNRGSRAFGLLFKDCNDSLIEDNLLIENTTAIFMDGSNRNRFVRNVMAKNGWALDLFTSCIDNIFTENSFIGNDFDLLLDTRRNPNRFYDDSKGNYWSSYRGYDLDGNGIGDVPHQPLKYYALISKRYPDVRLLTGGLAVQAMQWAERSFPLLHVTGVEDPFPLMRPPKSSVSAALPSNRRSVALLLTSALMLMVAGLLLRKSLADCTVRM